MRKVLALLTLALFATLPVHAAPAAEKLTVMLDWFPNVDHVPLFVARDKGFLKEAGIEVEYLSPSETADALKLAAAGQVDLAVGYQPQTIVAASAGIPVRAVGRLVEHPLSTLLFLKGKGFEKPSDLSGKKIGYTVAGMMDILLKAFAERNGVANYEAVNVGFTIVPSLAAGTVDAIMGPFKNYETVELEHKGLAPQWFELEKHGIPDYDELIIVAGKNAFAARKAAIRRFTKCLAKGIAWTREHPQEALELYFAAVPEAPRDMEREAFARTLPQYASSQRFDRKGWEAFAAFAKQSGLIEREVSLDDLLQGE